MLDSPLNPVLESLLESPGLGTSCLPDAPIDQSELPVPECVQGEDGFKVEYEVT